MGLSHSKHWVFRHTSSVLGQDTLTPYQMTKLKKIADEKLKVANMMLFLFSFDRVQNIVEKGKKGKNAGYQNFFILQQKSRSCGKGLQS